VSKEKTVEQLQEELSDALKEESKSKRKRDDAIAGGEYREYEIIEKGKTRGTKS
jgi:hypothetical protein